MDIHRVIDFCSKNKTNNQKQELKIAWSVSRDAIATNAYWRYVHLQPALLISPRRSSDAPHSIRRMRQNRNPRLQSPVPAQPNRQSGRAAAPPVPDARPEPSIE